MRGPARPLGVDQHRFRPLPPLFGRQSQRPPRLRLLSLPLPVVAPETPSALSGGWRTDAFTSFMRQRTRFLFVHRFAKLRPTPPFGSMHSRDDCTSAHHIVIARTPAKAEGRSNPGPIGKVLAAPDCFAAP